MVDTMVVQRDILTSFVGRFGGLGFHATGSGDMEGPQFPRASFGLIRWRDPIHNHFVLFITAGSFPCFPSASQPVVDSFDLARLPHSPLCSLRWNIRTYACVCPCKLELT